MERRGSKSDGSSLVQAVSPQESGSNAETEKTPDEHPNSEKEIVLTGGTNEHEETPIDPDLVTWDGPEDPANPRNWPLRRRWILSALISFFNVVGPLSSSIAAPAIPTIKEDLQTSDTVGTMILSIYMLAFSFGPLITSPLSEMYGRVPVLQGGNAFFVVFNTACGFAKTPAQILCFRFLSGMGGCASQSIGGATLGDMFTPVDRGAAVSIYSVAPLVGTVAGALAGGALTQYAHWSWCFWTISILDVLIQLIGLAFLKETYPPVLLRHKRNVLAKATGNGNLKTEYDGHRNWKTLLAKNMKRPFHMLGTQPLVQIMSVYQGYAYGLSFMLSATMAMVFEDAYGQTPATASLNFVAPSIGVILVAQSNPWLGNMIYKRLTSRASDKKAQPEFRLPLLLPAAVLIVVGLLWYGWSAQYQLHVVMPNVGAVLLVAGTNTQFFCVNQYLIDTYTLHAASALGAATILRGVFGFGVPLMAPEMFAALGLGLGMTILAIGAAVIGLAGMWIVWTSGRRLRETSQFARK